MSINIHRSRGHQGNPGPICTRSIEVQRALREPKFNKGEMEEPLYIWGFIGSSLGWKVWKNMIVRNLFKWSCITLAFEVIWGWSLHYSISAYPINPTSLNLQCENWRSTIWDETISVWKFSVLFQYGVIKTVMDSSSHLTFKKTLSSLMVILLGSHDWLSTSINIFILKI